MKFFIVYFLPSAACHVVEGGLASPDWDRRDDCSLPVPPDTYRVSHSPSRVEAELQLMFPFCRIVNWYE